MPTTAPHIVHPVSQNNRHERYRSDVAYIWYRYTTFNASRREHAASSPALAEHFSLRCVRAPACGVKGMRCAAEQASFMTRCRLRGEHNSRHFGSRGRTLQICRELQGSFTCRLPAHVHVPSCSNLSGTIKQRKCVIDVCACPLPSSAASLGIALLPTCDKSQYSKMLLQQQPTFCSAHTRRSFSGCGTITPSRS